MTALSRQQRRALNRLSAGMDRVTGADRAFFDRHPERSFRIRLMSAPERAQREIVQGPMPEQPAGVRWFCVVRKITADVRLRVYVGAPAELAGDEQPETPARRLWQDYTSRHPGIAEREAMMLAAVQPGGSLHGLDSRGGA